MNTTATTIVTLNGRSTLACDMAAPCFVGWSDGTS
jgi:hypothetical protein